MNTSSSWVGKSSCFHFVTVRGFHVYYTVFYHIQCAQQFKVKIFNNFFQQKAKYIGKLPTIRFKTTNSDHVDYLGHQFHNLFPL